jgi:hypothetical protein
MNTISDWVANFNKKFGGNGSRRGAEAQRRKKEEEQRPRILRIGANEERGFRSGAGESASCRETAGLVGVLAYPEAAKDACSGWAAVGVFVKFFRVGAFGFFPRGIDSAGSWDGGAQGVGAGRGLPKGQSRLFGFGESWKWLEGASGPQRRLRNVLYAYVTTLFVCKP